jgi:hypothetical protein
MGISIFCGKKVLAEAVMDAAVSQLIGPERFEREKMFYKPRYGVDL